jgi:tetratricopeptide (TPR) repeat protein
LLFGAVLLAYVPALTGGLLWDDPAHLTRPELRSLLGLGRIWFEPGATQQYYPLLHTAFWVEHRLWGDATLGYHLVNVLLHAAAAGLLFQLLRRLLNGESSPSTLLRAFASGSGATGHERRRYAGVEWLAAALFALHPVCVESVAWISEQKNTLSTVLYLAAALVYLRFDDRRRWSHYAVAAGLFVAAMLTKSVTATLPAALLVVLWWRDGRLEWRRVWPLLPWLAAGLAAGLLTAAVERAYVIAGEGSDYTLDLLQRCLLAGRAVWFYVGKLVWPADLMFIYPRWQIDAAVAWQWLPALGVAALLGVLWRRRQRGLLARAAAAGLAAALVFIGTLFPALGFFEVFPFRFSYVADHFQYLAAPGALALAAAGLVRLLAGRPPWVGRAFSGLLLAALGALTWRQCGMYRDVETLYRTTLARNPGCWLAEYNLGSTLRAAGRAAEAIPHLEQALRLKPDYPGALNNLGLALMDAGRTGEAAAAWQRLVRVQPGSAAGHCNLGNARRAEGRAGEAVAEYEAALRLDPAYADAAYDLGVMLGDLGKDREAADRFRQAVRLQPDFPPAWYGLGSSLQALGRTPEALAAYEQALHLKPDYPEVLNNLGCLLRNLGRLPEAAAEFGQALRLTADYAEAHNNLGTVFAMSDRLPEATAEFETAVRLRPGFAEAHCNLGHALAAAGRLAEAIAHYEAALRLKPDFVAAHLELAAALAQVGRTQEARAHDEAARRLQARP